MMTTQMCVFRQCLEWISVHAQICPPADLVFSVVLSSCDSCACHTKSSRRTKEKMRTTSPPRKRRRKPRQRNFVLIIGCHQRDVLGADGMRPVPGTPLHSDEVRVAAMNRLLKGKARVITANKRAPERDFLFHYQVDTTARNWEESLNDWLRTTHGGVITDVYLDYFFFLVSWYRQGYGQKWYDHLLVLNFSGFAYLPIPQDPRGDPLPTRDHKYHEQLKYDVWEKRGQFLKGNQLTTVPWCKATMNVHEDLVAVDSRKNEAPTRNHRYQAHYRIEGILRISARQMQNLDYLRRGGRRHACQQHERGGGHHVRGGRPLGRRWRHGLRRGGLLGWDPLRR